MDPECNALIKEVPIRCQKNAIFVINTAALQNPDDILADDNGVYKNNGTSYNLLTTFDEEIHSESLKRSKLERDRELLPNQYLLSTTFYRNKSCNEFVRKIYDIRNKDGLLPNRVLQYKFEGKAKDFDILFHGNCKKNFNPHARKAESTKESAAEAVRGNTTGPSEHYDRLFEDAGGLFNHKSMASLPSIRGIKYQRSLQRGDLLVDPDPVAEFIKYGLHERGFIRNFQVLPTLCAVLAADNQINDIVNFCTDPAEFTILTIDTTYNICEGLYVTPLTYKHLRLYERESRKNPVLPGPAVVHSSLEAETFQYFSETLVRLNPKLKEILAVGSDRDKSIDNGFMKPFPMGRILSCKRHVNGNIKKKLTDLGITSHGDYLDEIFGDESSQVKVCIFCVHLVEFFFDFYIDILILILVGKSTL